jgi:hypothetical protein
LQDILEEHTVQQAENLLAILGRMALKPQVKFDKLYQKLYNVNLWLVAYQTIAPKPGNLTAGLDGKTIDGAGLKLIEELIADLKASRFKPKPVRRTYIPKNNGKLRPLGILMALGSLAATLGRWVCPEPIIPLLSFARCSRILSCWALKRLGKSCLRPVFMQLYLLKLSLIVCIPPVV